MRKFAISLLAALLAIVPCAAQSPPGFLTYLGSGRTPLSDPFSIYPIDTFFPPAQFVDTSGYTGVSCALVGGETTAVIMVIAQSLGANTVNASYTVTQAKNHQLNLYDGNCYVSKGVMLGVSNGSPTLSSTLARLGDKLIADAHYVRVIFLLVAVSGTMVSDWANSQRAPYMFNQIAVAARRLAAQGLTATHVIYMQGESDNLNGTSQANYSASLATVIAGVRSAGITAPMLVNKETWANGAVSSGIQAAQVAAVGSNNVVAGANLDVIDNTGRYDTTHLNATGSDTAAGLMEAQVILH
jgi:hypothetical protein